MAISKIGLAGADNVEVAIAIDIKNAEVGSCAVTVRAEVHRSLSERLRPSVTGIDEEQQGMFRAGHEIEMPILVKISKRQAGASALYGNIKQAVLQRLGQCPIRPLDKHDYELRLEAVAAAVRCHDDIVATISRDIANHDDACTGTGTGCMRDSRFKRHPRDYVPAGQEGPTAQPAGLRLLSSAYPLFFPSADDRQPARGLQLPRASLPCIGSR